MLDAVKLEVKDHVAGCEHPMRCNGSLAVGDLVPLGFDLMVSVDRVSQRMQEFDGVDAGIVPVTEFNVVRVVSHRIHRRNGKRQGFLG